MKDQQTIEHTVSMLLDMVDNLMSVIDIKMGNYYYYPEAKLLHEYQVVMKSMKQYWQENNSTKSKELTIKDCSNCNNHWYHYDGTNTGKFCWLESDGKECIANNFIYHALKKGENK